MLKLRTIYFTIFILGVLVPIAMGLKQQIIKVTPKVDAMYLKTKMNIISNIQIPTKGKLNHGNFYNK